MEPSAVARLQALIRIVTVWSTAPEARGRSAFGSFPVRLREFVRKLPGELEVDWYRRLVEGLPA